MSWKWRVCLYFVLGSKTAQYCGEHLHKVVLGQEEYGMLLIHNVTFTYIYVWGYIFDMKAPNEYS